MRLNEDEVICTDLSGNRIMYSTLLVQYTLFISSEKWKVKKFTLKLTYI